MELSSLNPFEFRASIQSSDRLTQARAACLNPFEFRASIQLARRKFPNEIMEIQTPLRDICSISIAIIRTPQLLNQDIAHH